MNRRRLTIYLVGVLMGCVLLFFIPRKAREERTPHPWQAQTAPYGYYPRTVTDDTGREVTLERQPRLLVSLAPSVTDMLVQIGMGDHVVGVTRWCDNPEMEGVARIGGLDAPDLERILELRPDLVIGTEMTPGGIYERLDAINVPALAFKHGSLDDVIDDMRTLALLLGVPRQGLEAVEALKQRRQAILDSVPDGPSPSAAVLYDFDTFGSAGRGNWVNDLLELLHIRNIAARAQSSWPTLSREALLAADPDFIILPQPTDPAEAQRLRSQIASMKDDPVWRTLSAVRNDRIVVLSPNLLSIPGPRSMQALEEIAHAVYGPGTATRE